MHVPDEDESGQDMMVTHQKEIKRSFSKTEEACGKKQKKQVL